jgi:hypothetical protein
VGHILMLMTGMVGCPGGLRQAGLVDDTHTALANKRGRPGLHAHC